MYGFDELTEGENYDVTPYSNEDILNGISSYDLVLISKHILEMQTLDSPYKLIAADVNKSGSITTMDLVDLRKVILHINEEFANNTSWRFVEADFVFPQPTNPFATIFPEAVSINGLTAEEEHDFVGVKVGDVNGSVVANALAGAEDRNTVGDLVFITEDQQLSAGETYDITFHSDNFNGIHGYQFTMNFDAEALIYGGVLTEELPNLNDGNFGLSKLKEGVITTSWTNQEAMSLTRASNLFTLRFTAKQDVLLSEVVSLNSSYTIAEAYNSDLELMNIDLKFNGESLTSSRLHLYQNRPNPFSSETLIGFDLPEAGAATLNIYDVNGILLMQVEGDYEKGYNNVVISNERLTTGLMYYELVTTSKTLVRKMVLQN